MSLRVIEKIKKNNDLYYTCECSYCKKNIDIRRDHLKSRKSDNCGCQKHNDASNNNRSKIYNIHQAMKQRCLNPNQKFYFRYGGRGITICDEWLDYRTFKKWALENGYSDDKDLDRIDNDKGYSPDNCRFISHRENCNNRSNNIRVEFKGEVVTIGELAIKYNKTTDYVRAKYLKGIRGEELVK